MASMAASPGVTQTTISNTVYFVALSDGTGQACGGVCPAGSKPIHEGCTGTFRYRDTDFDCTGCGGYGSAALCTMEATNSSDFPLCPNRDAAFRLDTVWYDDGSNLYCDQPGCHSDFFSHHDCFKAVSCEAAAAKLPGTITGCTDPKACGWSAGTIVATEMPFNHRCAQAGPPFNDPNYKNQPGCVQLFSTRCGVRDCTKTEYDVSLKAACCKGIGVGSDTSAPWCESSWCNSDPLSACFDVVQDSCTGTSSCGKHKFLDPEYENGFCNVWYLNRRDGACCGAQYKDYPGAETITQTHSACNSWDDCGSVTELQYCLPGCAHSTEWLWNEIGRYCAQEGWGSGECACWNALDTCSSGACIAVGAATGDGLATPLGWYIDGSSLTDSTAIPIHCRLEACQVQSNDCVFKNPTDLARPCPALCASDISNAPIHIGSISAGGTNTVHMDDALLRCGATSPLQPLPLGSAFALGCATPGLAADAPCLQLSYNVLRGTSLSVKLPIKNCVVDLLEPTRSTLPYVAYSDLDPIVRIVRGGSGTISSGEQVFLELLLDGTAAARNYDYNGILTVVDSSGRTHPAFIFLNVFFVDALPPNGNSGSGNCITLDGSCTSAALACAAVKAGK